MFLAVMGLMVPHTLSAADSEGVEHAQAVQQTKRITGKVIDSTGEPVIGASVVVRGTSRGGITDVNGNFSVEAAVGNTLEISFVGYKTQQITVTAANTYNVTLEDDAQALEEVVVTALGIKKDRKSLGYAIDEVGSEELMRNKSTNAINSLAGKIAGVNITQSSGAAGSGSQIILRGGTSSSESRDNQPLFVVDGVIYDNSSTVVGNSAFDGQAASYSTTSNRVMDINPEDIESMSVLKGPAASALYGSRATNGVVLITTKKGKEGAVEVNVTTKLMTSWAKSLPDVQTEFRRGFMEDIYDKDGKYTGTFFNDFSYNSWGDRSTEKTYDNIGDFFETGTVWDTNASVAGGTQNSSFYLSGSYYDQGGIVPMTGYRKSTFRFNGEQKFKMFTFSANVAYSDARTQKTLTSGGLFGSQGTGALAAMYQWSPFDDMTHYLNEDGTRYQMFGDRLDPWDERDNPYWIVNKNKLSDHTERFTGNFSVRADITKWWWISYRMGVDSYTTDNTTRIAADGAIKQVWQKGMMSDNLLRYHYYSNNLMTNFSQSLGDFNLNLMMGLQTDYTKTNSIYQMAWNFPIKNFFSYGNAKDNERKFLPTDTKKRLVGVFGEFRADWKNTLFFTMTGRNDWTSTLSRDNRSYFYPSFSGSVVFTQFLQDRGLMDDSILSFGKLRASWAKVGKDTSPYVTATSMWPVGTYLGNKIGIGNSWSDGNIHLKPEMTTSTELGIELRFFKNRLRFDYAYYSNVTKDQIISPRGPQSTGYIFRLTNTGTVTNKGMELAIGATPIKTRDLTWDIDLNMAGNRGKLKDLPSGLTVVYVTDVQYGNAKAASYNDGDFMGIGGTQWLRNEDGKVMLDANGMPRFNDNSIVQVGNREPKLTGGLNNTLNWKNFTFNMLWEFRFGGDVFNGTQYAMDLAGVSKESGDYRNQTLVIDGVDANGNDVHKEWNANETYIFNNKEMSGYNIIKNYYTGYHYKETANYLTKVNSLRLRTVSLAYELPKTLLAKTFIKRASVSVAATNLLLFTNYDGDPEVAASGAGIGGSSSVGFDFCGVPATSSMSFGVNLTF